MTEIQREMIYGSAKVDLLWDAHRAEILQRHGLGTIVERDAGLTGNLVWLRVEVSSWTPLREGGFAYRIRRHAAGWTPAQNARNFERLDREAV